MKIKEIEVLGFKSFVDKTTLSFQPGITSVVGPNGCGKSNIVDAIRWVMGEQSPRHLRGKDMEDVIFGGSEGRKPLGMAEVSIVFSNEDGNAPEEYREFGEIQVTRRLFRSGDSEYLINKVPCRLKDITELFMGTGVGTKAYSIVEQGQIGLILNSRPQERRFLIEEAAGITKYKSRKKEALARMESTQQNLQRVNDIVGEVKRQMNALDRQAKKAENFRNLRGEAREIELKLYAREYMSLADSLLIEEEKFRGTEDEGISMETRLRGQESDIEILKAALMVQERVLNELQERFYEKTSLIQKNEDKIGFVRSRKESIERQGIKFSEEVALLREELEKGGGEISRLRQELERNREELTVLEERLRVKSGELEQIRASFEEKGKGLDSLKGELVQIASQQAQTRNAVANLQRRIEEVSRRLEKSLIEGEDIEKRVAEVGKDVTSVGSRVEEAVKRKGALMSERDALVSGLDTLRERQTELEGTLRGMRDELVKKSSHLQSLETLEQRMEGYSDGVKAIKLSDKGSLYTVVSDIFETMPEYEIALEAALEGTLQHMIVDDATGGMEGIGYLRDKKAGRCGFIPSGQATAVAGENRPSFGVPILDKVSVKKGQEGLAGFLLGDTYLVDTLDVALASGVKGYRFVTAGGDVLHPSGIMVGGSQEVSGHGIIHRKREIRELLDAVEILKGQVEELDGTLRSVREERTGAEGRLDALKKDIHQAEIDVVHLEKDRQRHEEELKRLTQRLDVIRMETAQLHEDKARLDEELASDTKKLEELTAMKEGKDSAIREMQDLLLAGKVEMDRASSEVTDLRVEATDMKGRAETIKATLGRVEDRQKELEARIRQREDEVVNGSDEIARSDQEIFELKKSLTSIISEKEELEGRLRKERETFQSDSEKMRVLEGERQKVIRELEALRKELNAIELAVSKIRMEMGNISSKVSETFNIDIKDAAVQQSTEDIDENALLERHRELTKMVEELGEVNLTAIEEYNTLEERFRFLTEQQADLTGSLDTLQKAIQRINRISRERFSETFEAVNANFKVVFQRLFRGGKAELVLTDTEDLLEAGIDIIAQPPGKKLQGVSLMSGGEKALTAVSLIFSIFLLKPTPFCLLDEVDAPLDDANVGRFNDMVTEMSKTSQFILITHNKRSMEIADVLYGITMQEPGVSRLVSVRLRDETAKAA